MIEPITIASITVKNCIGKRSPFGLTTWVCASTVRTHGRSRSRQSRPCTGSIATSRHASTLPVPSEVPEVVLRAFGPLSL